jgi:GntR family transcriptional regulator, transcriptional repressor for pyruvate dehydrogenase complex
VKAAATTVRTGRAEPVYRSLKLRIAAEDFASNGRLPSEQDLAAQFGVSRGVVRQALGRLREEDLIESFSGSGSYVVPDTRRQRATFSSLNGIEDIEWCYEFRIFLDGEAAGLAAERRKRSDLIQLRKTLTALDSTVLHGNMGTRLDIQFHETVARASQNPFFFAAVTSLQGRIRELVALPGALSMGHNRRRLAAVQREHWSVLEAIDAGDARRARLMMRAHIINSRSRALACGAAPEVASTRHVKPEG